MCMQEKGIMTNHIYIGDRQLEPDDEPECYECDGLGFIAVLCDDIDAWHDIKCPVCHGEGSDND